MFRQQHVQIENLCKMAAGWTMVATTAFYSMWGGRECSTTARFSTKNQSIYEKISSKFSVQGYNCS